MLKVMSVHRKNLNRSLSASSFVSIIDRIESCRPGTNLSSKKGEHVEGIVEGVSKEWDSPATEKVLVLVLLATLFGS